ncbi:S41 family peptidase [Rhodanobacter sp. C01]|uniref:S41 family peptidase n=1 Tax=Rhodanobacter sp. C01 TaxID=1945856 RepID=UPI00143C4B19|nr:S41 family peptidase [Rhodanobacter sp. C01]
MGTLLGLLATTWVSASPDTADPGHEQVVAFARLYGVVRYFYPGDAAQGIDWNRFAVAGITDARQAHGRAELRDKLNALFGPLGPGIDIVADEATFPALPAEAAQPPLVAWRYLGFPAKGTLYAGERTSRGGDRFVGIASELDAQPLQGKTIRLRGSIKALGQSTVSGLGLWLRADRKGKPPGFFKNTDGSQVHDLAWHDYVITAPVGTDVSILAFGFTMIPGDDAKEPTAAFRNLTLDVSDGHGGWKPVAIPALRLAPKPSREWSLVGSIATDNTSLSWQQTGADPGYLVLQQHGQAVDRTLFDAPPVAGKTAEFALGAGLKARVALTLTDMQARSSSDRAAALQALKARLAHMPDPAASIASSAAREADIVVAWNVFRHFYPYWDVIHVDWDSELPRALADAERADSRAAQKRALQHLLAPLEDAHGTVADTTEKKWGSLPITLEPVEHQWVIVATGVPDQAKVGDVIASIDGVAMPQAQEQAEALASGQTSSLAWKALQGLQWGPASESHTFGLKHADGSASTVSLAYSEQVPPATARPAAITELKPGIWYVDLARTDIALFTANLTQLAAARTVIYDVRGYPRDFKVSTTLPAHLLDHAEQAKWMHIPRYVGPFGELAGYTDVGWNIQPAAPHFSSHAIFLADGRTISQAEAIMGYVQDEKLGTIVGATTRGVDGNITSFEVPLGFRVIFTGMKVTHHDGVSRYHALGTIPDVTVQPTLAGVRAGHDEVLEAALKLAQ